MMQNKINSKKLETGISQLDDMIGGGLSPGSFITIASTPGTGKTSLAIQIASHIADCDREVAFHSMENNENEIRNRIKIQGGNSTNSKFFSECRLKTTADDICKTVMNSNRFYAVFIDYLQLLSNNYSIVNDISILKSLAIDKNIPVVIASQLDHNCMNRRPTLNDLGYSGILEKEADVIIIPYRTHEGSELIVAKNSFGKAGSIPVIWNKEKMKFEGCKS